MNMINKMKYTLKTMIIIVLFQGVVYNPVRASGGKTASSSGELDLIQLKDILEKNYKADVDNIKNTSGVLEYYNKVLDAIKDKNFFVDYRLLPEFSAFIKAPLEKTPLWRRALRLSTSDMCIVFEKYFSPFLNISTAELEKSNAKMLYRSFLTHIFTLAQEGKCWQKQLKSIENELKLLKPSLVGQYIKYGRQAKGTETQQADEKNKADFLLRAMADSAMRNYLKLAKEKEIINQGRTMLQKVTFRGKAQEPDVYMLAVFSVYKSNFSPSKYTEFRNQMLHLFENYIYNFKIDRIEAVKLKEQISKKTEVSHIAKYGKYYFGTLATTAAISAYLYLNWEDLKKTYGAEGAKGILNYLARSIKASPWYFWDVAKELPGKTLTAIKASPEYLKTKGGEVITYVKEVPERFKGYLGKKYEEYFKRGEKTEAPGTEATKEGFLQRAKNWWNKKPEDITTKNESSISLDERKKIDKIEAIDNKTGVMLGKQKVEKDLQSGSTNSTTILNDQNGNPKNVINTNVNTSQGTINTNDIKMGSDGEVDEVKNTNIDVNTGTVNTVEQKRNQISGELETIVDTTKKLAKDTSNTIKENLQEMKKDAQEMKKHAQEEGLKKLTEQGITGVVKESLIKSMIEGSEEPVPNPTTEFP